MKLIKKDREIDLPITSGCLYRKELMKEHFVRLVFDDVNDDVVEVGDYVVWEGMKYTLLKPYIPEQIEIGKYRYNVEFQAPEMLWKQKYFVYKDIDKAPETEWNMRADAYTWMQAITKAIKLETGRDTTYLVNELIEGTQYLEIANDSIFGGLNKIAEAFDTEWWYDGDIHLGRYEQGEVKELIVGDNVNAPRVELVDDYFTRLIPLGSDRNIPQNTDAKFVNYKNRLKLNEEKYPNGYIDIEELPIEKVVPKTVIFEDIYPKSYLFIDEVKRDYDEEDKQYIYSVKLKDYTLDKDDIIEGLVPVISFQDGLLNGREFELNVGEWLTLINQEEGGIIIPNDQLEPRKGDSIILANIKLPDEYIKDAQEELEYEALRIIARQKQDLNSYRISTCPVNFDIDIYVGDKVKLDNFGKITNTRVLAVEYPLDTPSKKNILIGNNRTKGFIDRLLEEAEIDKLKAQLKKGKDGNSVTLKGKLDSTDKLPTNPKKGDSYWIGTVLYTWNGIDWVTQDLQGEHGESGSTPYIKDGFWWINGENTGFVAKGEDGNTPYIGQNGNWWIDGQDTGIDPKGKTGAITYIAGLYNDSATYKGTITKRPVVYQPDNDLVPRVGSYYFLKNIGEFKGKSPKDHPEVWEKADEFNVILTDTLVAHFAKVGGAVFYGDLMMSQWGTDASGNQSSNYDQHPDNFTPYFMVNYKTGEFVAQKGTLEGHIDAYSGTIGGFKIDNDRIGAKVNPNEDEAFGNLALYKDFFRIGGSDGYAMLGNNVLPLSLGGAHNATGRIVNNTQNTGSQWGFDSSNYGLLIDVKGGTKNYGINSNAPLLAPAFIGTRVETWNLNGSSYKIDFSQASVYVMRRRTGVVEVTMPSASSVAQSFGYTKLPEGFGFVFTVVMLDTSRGGKVILKNLHDRNQNPDNFSFTGGDNATIMAYVHSGELNYHLLSYNT